MAPLILSWLLGAVAVVVAGVAGANAVIWLQEFMSRTSRSATMRKRMEEASSDLDDITAHTKGKSARAGSKMDALLNTGLGLKFETSVIASGLEWPPDVLLQRMLVSAAAFLVVGTLLFGNPVPGLVLAAATLVVPYFWLEGRAEARIEKMREQLPDALTVLGNSLASGLSLVQALEYAANETPDPLGRELWRVVHDVSAGMSLSEALDRFRESIPLRELQTVAAALEVQRRVGGNLREMLEQATTAVREGLELKMQLQVKTAQGRMSSKVVGFLPLALTGVIALFDPSYVTPFFTTPIGMLLLIMALLLEVTGFVLIRKITEVEM